jgi:hypothetical protein
VLDPGAYPCPYSGTVPPIFQKSNEKASQLTSAQLEAINLLAQQAGFTDAHIQTMTYVQAVAFRFATSASTLFHAVPNLRNPMLWRLIGGE